MNIVAATLTGSYGKQPDNSQGGQLNLVAATLGQRMRGQDDSAADNLIIPQTFDWQSGVAKDDRAWLVDKPGRTRALTSSRTLAVFGGNNTSGERSGNTSLTAHPTGRLDFETENFVCGALSATHGGPDDNSGQAGHLVVVSVAENQRGEIRTADIAAQLTGGGGKPGQGYPAVFAFTERTRTDGRALEAQEGLSYALTNPGNGGRTQERQIAGSFGVRRLTPRECERLQGFEDDWTAWGLDENGQRIEMSDSARYRMIGNAVCRAVSNWIDRRIVRYGYD